MTQGNCNGVRQHCWSGDCPGTPVTSAIVTYDEPPVATSTMKASLAPEPVGRAATARVIYLVTEDWYFISHRLPMARAARAAGFDVHVATRVDRHGAAIAAEGFGLHPVAWQRGSLSPRDL